LIHPACIVSPSLPWKIHDGEYYYAFIEMQGEGRLQVGMAGGGASLDGAVYQDHLPYNSQMAFSLVYDRGQAFIGLLRQGTSWFGMLLLSIFLYLLPGWAILRGFWKGWNEYDWVAKAALSAGISLALTPLLFLWTDLIGLHLGAGYAWLPGIAAIFALLWMNRQSLISTKLLGLTGAWGHFLFGTSLVCSYHDTAGDILRTYVSVSNLDLPVTG
jgi:hypothetical protein